MWDRNDPVKQSLNELGSELKYQRAVENLPNERILRPLRRDTKIAMSMAIILAIAMVVAAVNLFTHTFPSGTTGADLTTACSTLTMGTPSAPVGPGTVRFNCGASTPAFASAGSGPVPPTVTLGTLYTGRSTVTSPPLGTSSPGDTPLTSG